jgi:anti-anti-sigma factor
MLRLKCLNCGLAVRYRGSGADVCPRCLARTHQAVQLIPVSDQPSRSSRRSIGRLSIHTTAHGERRTVALSGELDMASAPLLEAALHELCETPEGEVVLDMRRVEFIDSSGLNAILRGQRLCESSGCRYSLTPLQWPAQAALEASGVIGRLPIDTPAAAQDATPPARAAS